MGSAFSPVRAGALPHKTSELAPSGRKRRIMGYCSGAVRGFNGAKPARVWRNGGGWVHIEPGEPGRRVGAPSYRSFPRSGVCLFPH